MIEKTANPEDTFLNRPVSGDRAEPRRELKCSCHANKAAESVTCNELWGRGFINGFLYSVPESSHTHRCYSAASPTAAHVMIPAALPGLKYTDSSKHCHILISEVIVGRQVNAKQVCEISRNQCIKMRIHLLMEVREELAANGVIDI